MNYNEITLQSLSQRLDQFLDERDINAEYSIDMREIESDDQHRRYVISFKLYAPAEDSEISTTVALSQYFPDVVRDTFTSEEIESWLKNSLESLIHSYKRNYTIYNIVKLHKLQSILESYKEYQVDITFDKNYAILSKLKKEDNEELCLDDFEDLLKFINMIDRIQLSICKNDEHIADVKLSFVGNDQYIGIDKIQAKTELHVDESRFKGSISNDGIMIKHEVMFGNRPDGTEYLLIRDTFNINDEDILQKVIERIFTILR